MHNILKLPVWARASLLAVVVEELYATPATVRGKAAVPVATTVRDIAVAVGVIARDVMAASVVPAMPRTALPRPAPDIMAQHDVALAVGLVFRLCNRVRPESVRIIAGVGNLAVLNENILMATVEAAQPDMADASQTWLRRNRSQAELQLRTSCHLPKCPKR